MGLWRWLRGPTSTGFDSWSTAELVTDGVDGTDLTAIVTGATSGLGKETSRVLALRGVTVIMTARCMEKGLQVRESLLKENPNAKLHVMELDLSSLRSVRAFAHIFNLSKFPLNILINNAGIFGCPFQLSVDGVEMQFATNYLGHFLLTNLLLDKLKSTAKETGIEGRIVNVSSLGHRYAMHSTMDMKALNDPNNYHRYTAYARSKLANVLHANELARQLQAEGCNVTANSLHPGIILITNIRRFADLLDHVIGRLLKPVLKDVAQGAAGICLVALNPAMRGVTGKYFASNCNEMSPSREARDEVLAKSLWSFSLDLVQKLQPQLETK